MNSVTIAIAYYRSLPKDHFAASVGSALAQTYAHTRVIIFAESALPADLRFPGCRVKRVPRNVCGRPAAVREYMVDAVATPFLAFWDADDIYTPDRLDQQIGAMREQGLDLCFSNFQPFDQRGTVGPDYFSRIGLGKRDINVRDENIMGLGITTARTAFLRRLRPFPHIRTLDWWMLISSHLRGARVGCLDNVHGYYRVHHKSSAAMLKQVSRADVARERREKAELYGLFSKEADLKQRADFFHNADVEIYYRRWQRTSSRYRNIWGGLIPYEK